jgi:hypothetical protein
MYLEALTFKNSPTMQIPEDHPAYWIEGFLKGAAAGMSRKHEHDEEHVRQLTHWKCDPEHLSKLTMRKDENGNLFNDRLYHCMLHLAFWKETSQNQVHIDAVKRFEDQFNFNLDDLTRPNPADAGSREY